MNIKEFLYIKNYDFSDLSLIEHIDCENCEITSLEGIELLNNITHLYCSHNKIKSLKGIEHCKKLREIYCTNNLIDSIEEIIYLDELYHFSYRNNPITSKYISMNHIVNSYEMNELKTKLISEKRIRTIKKLDL